MLATLLLMGIIALVMMRLYEAVRHTDHVTKEPFANEDSEQVTGEIYGPSAAKLFGPAGATQNAVYPVDDANHIMDDRYTATTFRFLGDTGPDHPMSESTITPSLIHPYTPYENYNPEYDDPRDIPWLASLSPLDRKARDGNNCAAQGTEDLGDGITLITVSKSCEAGLPHTRAGDRIIMPDSIPESLQSEILKHERIHIYQRRDPSTWANFYRKWNFTLHAEPPKTMPADIRESRRSNPDTFTKPWACWQGRYWPVSTYDDILKPSLRKCTTVWWDETDHRLLTSPPPGWTTFFGTPSQDEHPHEISAVMLVAGNTSSEAGRLLMNWWHGKKHLYE